jgi:hypothetical protein
MAEEKYEVQKCRGAEMQKGRAKREMKWNELTRKGESG